MIIKSHIKDYSVNFQPDFDFVLGLQSPNTLFVIDKNIVDLYDSQFASSLSSESVVLFDALEQNKTIETALALSERFIKLASKRNSVIVSIGGGITQDVTGFLANILYRGIRWVFVPTTLLAQCDSCIGSKTSLNYKSYKNLLGTFYPPDEVVVCAEFTKTLSELDYCSGLGEITKFAFMQGNSGLVSLENNLSLLLKRDMQTLKNFIALSLEFKKTYIEEDEFDQDKRILLNFGHTFGHAIETTSEYAIPHGIAILLGTLMANRIAVHRKLLDREYAQRLSSVADKVLRQSGITVPHFDAELIIQAMRKDKKQTRRDSIKAILPENNMTLTMVSDISATEIELALNYIADTEPYRTQV
jgi:3-dehydroquinate synthase